MAVKVGVTGILLMMLWGCTGNNSSEVEVPNSNIKLFLGVIKQGDVQDFDVIAYPIAKHGQRRLDINGNPDGTWVKANDSGRYRLAIKADNNGPHILEARGRVLESNEQRGSLHLCQWHDGCLVNEEINVARRVAFGNSYHSLEPMRWHSAVHTVSEGQFIVINPITEMAQALASTLYVDGGSQEDIKEEGDTPKYAYYSVYSVLKANTQVSNLLDLEDVVAVEPADLTRLDQLTAISSQAMQESIRYGALLAAWQKMQLDYDANALATDAPKDDNYQAQVISEFLADGGQLYYSLDDQGVSRTLDYSLWLNEARANLQAVRVFHQAAGRVVPKEVMLVLNQFDEQLTAFSKVLVKNTLSAVQGQVDKAIEDEYLDAIGKTQAMVNRLANLGQTVASDEYRTEISNYYQRLLNTADAVAPSMDGLFTELMDLNRYYMSCVAGSCDVGSSFHAHQKSYNVQTKSLVLNNPYDATRAVLKISQAKVFLSDKNKTNDADTRSHDLLISGEFESAGVRLVLADSSAEAAKSDVPTGIRFSFEEPLAELPQAPALVENGQGATVDDALVPDGIELVLPDFELYRKDDRGGATELTLSGAFSALMAASVDRNDRREGVADTEKKGKRYNLASVSMTLKTIGHKEGETREEDRVVDLRDNFVISLNAGATSVAGDGGYFPATQYPTMASFFVPKDGLEKGLQKPLVTTNTGTFKYPALDDKGFWKDPIEEIDVKYVELAVEGVGALRYTVHPKSHGREQYVGLLCIAAEDDLDDLNHYGSYKGPLRDKNDDDGDNDTSDRYEDEDGNEVETHFINCRIHKPSLHDGEALPQNYMKDLYRLSGEAFGVYTVPQEGEYRVTFPTLTATDTKNTPELYDDETYQALDFSNMSDWQGREYLGVLEAPVVLGVDNLRFQLKAEIVEGVKGGEAPSQYLPETVLDLSLLWPTREVMEVNAFISYDADHIFNNPNGSGLPWVGLGDHVESYALAYRVLENGTEMGDLTINWGGVQFVDGNQTLPTLERSERKDDGILVAIGSNVGYRHFNSRQTPVAEERCGFIGRGQPNEGTDGRPLNCEAVAQFTYRGLITGAIYEERDGVYVVRYIDGSLQIFGG